ncbi:leucine efflux protein LeuE [Streptomyces samsunensis]|uniref:leucine efflux protein LeuE n=2 Tax=Streptomyces TaxID=1883 RepID=UPI0011CE93AD|nr:leucine efflux protein LeuE [Streptomyces samsunensis]MCQ6245140.1 leucine efflux protein LeuE [Streptomyces malaysiensis]NUH36368.1 leucine efflux protein LeuE [Streptomyces samsunensis]
MLGITDLSTYLAGLALIVLLPGPNSLYVVSVAARRGPRTGYRAAAGVLCGDAVLMALSAGGVASLLHASPMLFAVVKFAGAGYLTWLAVGMLRGARTLWRRRPGAAEAARSAAAERGADGAVDAAVDTAAGSAEGERPYRRALVISLLNPKAILFFISFFVQFVDPDYAHPALSFVALGAWAQLFSITYLSVLIFSGTYLAATLQRRRRLRAGLSAAAGTAFLGFAAKLSLSSAG